MTTKTHAMRIIEACRLHFNGINPFADALEASV